LPPGYHLWPITGNPSGIWGKQLTGTKKESNNRQAILFANNSTTGKNKSHDQVNVISLRSIFSISEIPRPRSDDILREG